MQGITDTEEEEQEEVNKKVQGLIREIRVDINPEDIKEISKLGTFKPIKKRLILVKFRSWNKKLKIFKCT